MATADSEEEEATAAQGQDRMTRILSKPGKARRMQDKAPRKMERVSLRTRTSTATMRARATQSSTLDTEREKSTIERLKMPVYKLLQL